MCRFLLYLGPEVLVSSVVVDPDHGMLQQASKAHDLITPLNADGFGVAWNLTFMHNGTVPHYKFIKRQMLQTLSDNSFNLIQGTTDSEMMFAMFVTIFERLSGDKKGPDVPFAEGKDYTEDLAAAMRETLRQVHKFALDYENSLEASPDTQVQSNGLNNAIKEQDELDGADAFPELACTKATGRLNLAVTDGNSIVSARYVCSDPSTAHTLYYTRGTGIQYQGKKCSVAKCPNGQPMVVVSSEPLGSEYECEVVPVNHMVIAGPKNFFSIKSCK